MNQLENLSSGLKSDHQNSVYPVKKPLTASQSGDVSACIETVSGRLVNPTNPLAENITLSDIAWATSRIPRFAGHTITEVPYNVAQHSVYVAELAAEMIINKSKIIEIEQSLIVIRSGNIIETLIKALLHDAHEAYTGDIPSPVKRIPELRETLKIIEMKLDHAIFSAFNLPELTDSERILIKYCDRLAQAIESYQFMPSRGLNWNLPAPTLVALQKFPQPKSPLLSYENFISHYNYLLEQ